LYSTLLIFSSSSCCYSSNTSKTKNVKARKPGGGTHGPSHDPTTGHPPSEVEWFEVGSQLLGGLSLFLYGMKLMSRALKSMAGERLKEVIGALTRTKMRGFLTGLVSSAVMQSSTVVTVMLVGFVGSNFMSFQQSISIILGAGVGSTAVSQIIAMRITKYCFLMITVGFLLMMFETKKIQRYGSFIFGMGLMFYGMEVMTDAMLPLRGYAPFLNLLASMSNPLYGLFISTLFTLIIQSSSATISVIIALASQNMLTLRNSIALILGANIGTCGTACLAAIGKSRAAIRVAFAHVFTKLLGSVLVLPFIDIFVWFVELISPSGFEALPRQIANAHTLFNLFVGLLFLPLLSTFVDWSIRWIPDR
jgi:phosphate:Na+ symporter